MLNSRVHYVCTAKRLRYALPHEQRLPAGHKALQQDLDAQSSLRRRDRCPEHLGIPERIRVWSRLLGLDRKIPGEAFR